MVMMVASVVMAAMMVIRLSEGACRENHEHGDQENFFHRPVHLSD
jgi:hypothetical protein